MVLLLHDPGSFSTIILTHDNVRKSQALWLASVLLLCRKRKQIHQ